MSTDTVTYRLDQALRQERDRLGALDHLPERALQVEQIVVPINGKQAASVPDLPRPAPRRTPPTSAVPKPSHGAGSPLRRLHDPRST